MPLKTFGGQSSGAGPLKEMHRMVRERMREERVIGSRDIVDIMNIIGRCVVAGNIRRVAEIAIGERED